MYEKILAQLIAKHSGVPKVVLGLLAKKIEPKVTEESQIEGAINDFETNSPVTVKDYADLLQSESDKRVTEALKKAKVEQPDPKTHTPDSKAKDDDQNDISKIVAEQLAKALEPIQAITKTIQNNNKIGTLKSSLKEKGIDESWADDVVIGDDFDEVAVVTRLEEKWNKAIQTGINKQVSDGKIRVSSGNGDNSSFKETVKSWNAEKAPTKESGFNIQEV